MLPKEDGKLFYGVKDKLGGQMLVFSFHVLGAEEIRCYLFCNGQFLRFHPNDVVNILPILYKNSDKVRSALLEKWNQNEEAASWKERFDNFKEVLQDKRFEQFYEGLVGSSWDIGIRGLDDNQENGH